MKITKRQLGRIIREVIDTHELEEPLGGWAGDALHNDPDYAHRTDTDATPQKLKLADLVRAVDYEGDGRGGGFKPVVGKQVGTVIEIDEDPDYPTQYTVLFPDGTTIMDDLGPPGEQRFELVNENKMKITKRQLRRIIREAITTASDEEFDKITMPGYKGPQPAPGSLEYSINKKPWSGGPNEIMTISSGDVAWESHALGNKTHRKGDVFVDSLPGGVTIKDASEEYTLKKGIVVSPKWQSFTGQDKDGVRVTVTPRTDWK